MGDELHVGDVVYLGTQRATVLPANGANAEIVHIAVNEKDHGGREVMAPGIYKTTAEEAARLVRDFPDQIQVVPKDSTLMSFHKLAWLDDTVME